MLRTVNKSIKWMALLVTAVGFSDPSMTWAAPWQQPMTLKSAEDQAQAFLKIQTLIPSMSDGANRYGFDPVTLLNHQTEIDRMMGQNPLFDQLKIHHPDLMEYKIYVNGPGESSEKDLYWMKWSEKTNSYVNKLGLRSADEILKEIEQILNSPLMGKGQGIVVGLAQLIPGQDRKDFFSASLEDKIKTLEKTLPEEVVSQGFAPQKLGWTDAQISKSEIIHRLKEATQLENKVISLMMAHFVAEQSDFNAKSYLQGLALNNKKLFEQVFNSHILKRIPGTGTDSLKEVSLIIKEVPPLVGMFRGFAGNDCSTFCSFPFVNSPNEFTFFVYDGKNGMKGYAQGTRVLSENQSSFYLHTIAGPRISKSDAEMIVQFFDQEKERFKFKEILFPPMSQIKQTVNFLPIRQAFQEVIGDQDVAISYQDESLRQLYKSEFKIDKEYDDAESNPVAHKLNKSKFASPLSVGQQESPTLAETKFQFERNSLLLNLIQLNKSKGRNAAIIEALAPLVEISENSLNEINLYIENSGQIASEPFIAGFEDLLARKGYQFKSGVLRKNISLIAKGLLKSPDLANDEKLKDDVISSLLDQREFSTLDFFLQENPDYFKSTKLTTQFFKAFYNDIHEAEFKSSKVLKIAMEKNPKAFLGNKELLSSLSKAPSAIKMINSYIDSKPYVALKLSAQEFPEIAQSRHQTVLLRNELYSALKKTTTEREYYILVDGVNKRIKDYSEAAALKKDLIVNTIDHYISLNPKEYTSIQYYVLNQHKKDEIVKKALKKLAPYVLRYASSNAINQTIQTYAQLHVESDMFQSIDSVVAEAISLRADKERLIPYFESQFPGTSYERSLAPSCRRVFNTQ